MMLGHNEIHERHHGFRRFIWGMVVLAFCFITSVITGAYLNVQSAKWQVEAQMAAAKIDADARIRAAQMQVDAQKEAAKQMAPINITVQMPDGLFDWLVNRHAGR
jgi:hypothetical protein